jgi:hypothetical protein
VHKLSWQDKKHAVDLLPYPPELIPFEPINTTDNRYSQLYWTVGKSPYKETGIDGFTHTPNNFALQATSSPRVISVTSTF